MPSFRRAITLDPPPSPLAEGLRSFSACDEEVDQAGCHAPGPLGRLALLLTHRGRAASWSDGVEITHRPRRLVVVAAGAIYEERLSPGAWWHLSYLLLAGPWCDPLNAVLRRRPGAALIVDQAPATVRNLLVTAVECALDGSNGWPWPALASIAGLVAELLARADQADDSFAARIGRLVDQEPERAWTIATLARHLRLSPATVARRFAAEIGCAPAAWIRHRRIEHARRLLAQDLGVAAVAERLGFANPYHFSRVFKAVAGVPPSHIRKAGEPSPLHGPGSTSA